MNALNEHAKGILPSSASPAATPIMFDSAMPTSKNRSGYFAAKSSTFVEFLRQPEGIDALGVVVAVDLDHVPLERTQLVCEGVEVLDLLDQSGLLDLVVVDDRGQAVDAEVARGHDRFPDLPLLRLPVAEHAEG